MSVSNQEKRTTERWNVRLACSFDFQGQTWRGTVTDLSSLGGFIEARDCCPPEKSVIEIQVGLSDRVLKLKGIVRHTGSFLSGFYTTEGFGVEFDQESRFRVALNRSSLESSARATGKLGLMR